MKKILKKALNALIILLCIVVCFSSEANAEINIPKPTEFKYVNDYTNTLSAEVKEYIVSVGRELEDKTGAQQIVVIVNSLEGNDRETYANKLFREWKIGQKDKNNGLLILISMKDRKRRVEVGYGLEGAITDIYSDDVMEKYFKPAFRAKKYDKGIKETYSIFADAIAKEYDVKLDKNMEISSNRSTSKENFSVKVILTIFGIIFLLDVILNKGRITRQIIILFFWNNRNGRGNPGGFWRLWRRLR